MASTAEVSETLERGLTEAAPLVQNTPTVIEQIQSAFHDVFAPVFHPMNSVLAGLPNWVMQVFGVGMFVMAMVWVVVFLNKDYVNHGRPYKSIWTDLRLWTCLSMLPHVAVYLYFR